MLIIQCLQTSISSLCHPIRVKFIIVYCICPVRRVQCYPFREVTGKINLIHKLTSNLTSPGKQKQEKELLTVMNRIGICAVHRYIRIAFL